MAGKIFRELLQDIFQQNLLIAKPLAGRGKRVDLTQISWPVFNVIGEYDDVGHPTSSLLLPDLVGGADKANLLFPTGHIGVVVSAAAHKKLWPQVG